MSSEQANFTTMSIETANGEKVIYMGRNGYDSDKLYANKYLTVGQTYTVKSMNVGSSSSTVLLEEVEGHREFNSVMFTNASDDFARRDWFGESYQMFSKAIAEARANLKKDV